VGEADRAPPYSEDVKNACIISCKYISSQATINRNIAKHEVIITL